MAVTVPDERKLQIPAKAATSSSFFRISEIVSTFFDLTESGRNVIVCPPAVRAISGLSHLKRLRIFCHDISMPQKSYLSTKGQHQSRF
jgi:hypothetical protein